MEALVTTTALDLAAAKLARLREVKKEASRRCRARAKAIASGDALTPELVVRSLLPTALKTDNFKVDLEHKSIRLNKNGGTAIALVIIEKDENGRVVNRIRKSFKDLRAAAKAFSIAIATTE